uniref:DUF6604 domain-containing protein n=1 Tax=Chromera velia CCMP2878 TaxID=1169474 RepID=A0A0G4FYC7_9ALVE|eukprot:Cvel_19353.t1-p1 / transcript=Cvel_19353.t1 / gene=Cvel_19353 / organism=Chromera_velia_CCMP2878 / gene_product=hypothetical protein / transcript_product=hypothetical protein / location=Cvel_scaffold1662:11914-18274(-) / protein_length=1057 / sequence_SO=supercontig / SO=protein_coding / is_pseudo=false
MLRRSPKPKGSESAEEGCSAQGEAPEGRYANYKKATASVWKWVEKNAPKTTKTMGLKPSTLLQAAEEILSRSVETPLSVLLALDKCVRLRKEALDVYGDAMTSEQGKAHKFFCDVLSRFARLLSLVGKQGDGEEEKTGTEEENQKEKQNRFGLLTPGGLSGDRLGDGDGDGEGGDGSPSPPRTETETEREKEIIPEGLDVLPGQESGDREFSLEALCLLMDLHDLLMQVGRAWGSVGSGHMGFLKASAITQTCIDHAARIVGELQVNQPRVKTFQQLIHAACQLEELDACREGHVGMQGCQFCRRKANLMNSVPLLDDVYKLHFVFDNLIPFYRWPKGTDYPFEWRFECGDEELTVPAGFANTRAWDPSDESLHGVRPLLLLTRHGHEVPFTFLNCAQNFTPASVRPDSFSFFTQYKRHLERENVEIPFLFAMHCLLLSLCLTQSKGGTTQKKILTIHHGWWFCCKNFEIFVLVYLYNALREVGALSAPIEVMEIMKKVTWLGSENRPTVSRGKFGSTNIFDETYHSALHNAAVSLGSKIGPTLSFFESLQIFLKKNGGGKEKSERSVLVDHLRSKPRKFPLPCKMSIAVKRLAHRHFDDVREYEEEYKPRLVPVWAKKGQGNREGQDAETTKKDTEVDQGERESIAEAVVEDVKDQKEQGYQQILSSSEEVGEESDDSDSDSNDSSDYGGEGGEHSSNPSCCHNGSYKKSRQIVDVRVEKHKMTTMEKLLERVKEAMDDDFLRVNLLAVTMKLLLVFQDVTTGVGSVGPAVQRKVLNGGVHLGKPEEGEKKARGRAAAMKHHQNKRFNRRSDVEMEQEMTRSVALVEVLGLLCLCDEAVNLDRQSKGLSVSGRNAEVSWRESSSRPPSSVGSGRERGRGGTEEIGCLSERGSEGDTEGTQNIPKGEASLSLLDSNPVTPPSSSSSSSSSSSAAPAAAVRASPPNVPSVLVSPVAAGAETGNEDEKGMDAEGVQKEAEGERGTEVREGTARPVDALPNELRRFLLKASDNLKKSIPSDLKSFRLFAFDHETSHEKTQSQLEAQLKLRFREMVFPELT